MRGPSALLVVCVALGAALGAALPGSAQARPRAMVAFLPTSPAPGMSLLFELERRGLTVGVTSPTIGGYRREQMLLDMTQGSRISRRAYAGAPPALRLAVEDLRVDGFDAAVRRAQDAPGEVVPGLLASTVRGAGLGVGYVGGEGAPPAGWTAYRPVAGAAPYAAHSEAAVAADRRGELGAASVGPDRTVAERALGRWRRDALVIVRLPPDGAGLRALDRALAARGPEDLVYVVRGPPVDDQLRLLPTGVAGPGFGGGGLGSDTTRRDGLVAATDMAPTILRHLGLPVPDEVDGRAVERRAGVSAAEVRELVERLDVVVGRRAPTVFALIATFLGLVGILAAARGRDGVRTALRISFLTALWLPGTALLTAALAPSRPVEVAIVALGSLLLGALTDRLVRWPLAPAVPAAVVFGAHAVDLAFGSPLIGQSLAGSSPKGGARFYGIGNELEGLLSMVVLLGLGAALGLAARHQAPRLFALGCLVAAAIMGAGRLGADVGAVITLGAGAAGAVLASLPGPLTGRRIAAAALVPVLAVVALVGVDVVTGGDAHLSRTVLRADEGEDLAEVVERRYRLLADDVTPPVSAFLILTGIAALWLGVRERRRLLRPLAGHPAFAAGMWGALAAMIVGALSNDSGPIIFQIGFVFLALAAGYVWGAPRERHAGAAT